MAEIHLESVTKRFGDVAAVQDIDLVVQDGEFVVLLGPTGAGKTTTLRLIAGLEKPTEGRVLIGGHDAAPRSPAERDVAFVFQQYSLYPHLSVYDNLAFPLRAPVRRQSREDIHKAVERVARMLRIDHKLENRATRLSGGEMQRVAIGRALVRQPSVYLMDEPLSSLDAKLRSELRLELQHIQRDLGATMLYVTHDQIEAMTMATRIGVLDHGRLVQIGTPREIYESPRNTYVATRLGMPAINLLPAGAFAGAAMPPGTTLIGARTEHIVVDRGQGGGPRARVEWIEHLGDQNHLHLVMGDHRLVTLVGADTNLSVGDELQVSLRRPLFFAADGERIAA
ncbi:carbohydrate ABC transporter ATP-binding protein (CUT1 family) [Dongia mobilis]|uniref:Carbohydrate ABC transporter ATP-binding protein (CUT1 family) n=1 Tax=Dongia mobilis TaxID=578943 RepID=A0A4R6WND8_9PROT|nr:ABC transporter ATP-binding protein [Dongia mobilis]TDQ77659.1 carbohydrate ABC transporter ATP-binding protein (CUT1 family) [Dongia mobilis]